MKNIENDDKDDDFSETNESIIKGEFKTRGEQILEARKSIPGATCSQGQIRVQKIVLFKEDMLLNTTFSDYVKIYTDGSVNLDLKKSGAGYYNQNSGESFYAPTNSRSSMDAELTAINAALVSCLELREKKVCILTDSKCSLELLKASKPSDYYFRVA